MTRTRILAAFAALAVSVLGLFAVTSAHADSSAPAGNKKPGGNDFGVSRMAVHGFPATSADQAKAKRHIARFMRAPGTAHAVKGHSQAVLDVLFGAEAPAVAGPDYRSSHDLIVTVAKGDVATDMIPIAPGAKVGPFRSAETVTDATDGRLVTVLLVGVDDPPAKDDLSRFNVAPAVVNVSAADHAAAHVH